MTDAPTPAIPINDAAAEHLVDAYGAEPMTDTDLLAAFQRTDGDPASPEACALAAEIERRNLDL